VKCGLSAYEMFENLLMRIFGRKRAKVTREWRKLHNDETHNFLSSINEH
jgi:hypothetical protein